MNRNRILQLLWKLSGDDAAIIEQCGTRSKALFAVIGMLVAMIFAVCFFSCLIAFVSLFNSYAKSVPIAVFFALTFTNIYLLLLYTFARSGLPHKQSSKLQFASTAGRFLFVCFIAIVVSKPIEGFLFSGSLRAEVETFRAGQIEKYEEITTNYFNREISELEHAIKQEQRLVGEASPDRINYLQRLITRRQEDSVRLNDRMKELARNSNYYVQGMIRLNRTHVEVWFVTILTITVFSAPAAIRRFTPENSNYYRIKEAAECDLVLAEYQQFKEIYQSTIKQKFHVELEYPEIFVDPPFNTERIRDERHFATEADFLAEVFNG